ncbi:DUF4142 domain-containing protein [Massilia sp. MS-15]|uniref:DUF4142 domain-containing protein n=1 Tax=Massilia sp. MS-15 TaxID=2878200 RepID=UPI001CD35492|nr:DUF4142 domain-containing protein [Massilia sp. MS-15]MCA1247506.1 DUF4142 domain-containing protein [Massilia sp. MS-15]
MQKNQVVKKMLAVGAFAAMFSAFGVQAQTSAQSATSQSNMTGKAGVAKLSAADKKTLTDMAIANMAEVETGKLALSKSQNAEVKTFAQQMVDDHGKALTEVQALAQTKGVTLPTELDAKHKAISAKLEKLSGEAFDREYMKTVGVTDHKQTHSKLQQGAKSAKDPDVKALATKMMPTVEQHLKAAQQMSSHKSGTTSGK